MWQPIETAPRDRAIILWNGHRQVFARWSDFARPPSDEVQRIEDAGGWLLADGRGAWFRATHWHPMVVPPTEEAAPHSEVAAVLLAAADAFEEAGDAEGVRRLKLLAKDGPRERDVCPVAVAADGHRNAKPLEPGMLVTPSTPDSRLYDALEAVATGKILEHTLRLPPDGRHEVALRVQTRPPTGDVDVRAGDAIAAGNQAAIVIPAPALDENGVALRDIAPGESLYLTPDQVRAIYSR